MWYSGHGDSLFFVLHEQDDSSYYTDDWNKSSNSTSTDLDEDDLDSESEDDLDSESEYSTIPT
jgi:hypothetical protein